MEYNKNASAAIENCFYYYVNVCQLIKCRPVALLEVTNRIKRALIPWRNNTCVMLRTSTSLADFA